MNKDNKGAMILQIFFDSKDDELIGIFSESKPEEKKQAIELLSSLDPPRANKYSSKIQK